MNDAVPVNERDLSDYFTIERAADPAGGLIDDPYPVWAELQAQAPVHKGTLAECMGMRPEILDGTMYMPGQTYYSVLGYTAVSEVFTRKDDFNSECYVDVGMLDEFGDTILSMDGPHHRHLRDILQEFFKPRAAESWWRQKVIDPLVDEIVTGLAGEHSADLNSQFFARLPLHTMTGGFGLSFKEGLELREHMHASLHSAAHEDRLAGKQRAGGLLLKTIHERRRDPRDDMISQLAHGDLVEDDGSVRKLTDEEITSYCRLIIFAGGETTWRLMGTTFFALMSHPEQLKEVMQDRSLLSAAVLEAARWHPDSLFLRKVARDTVLQGVDLPAGAHLHVCTGAANRDPSRWDNPEKFDIHRPLQRSVAFAAGAHSCLGQHVAREEISAALGALFDRFPNIRWDPSKPPAKLTGSLVLRGPGALHVLLD